MSFDTSASVLMRSFHLLLVEDNPGDAKLVNEVFHGCRSTVIHHVENTSKACDFLWQRAEYQDASLPDLILLDLNLPVLSGEVFLRIRQRIPEWTDIPLIVYTSSARDSDRQTCIFLGANDFIVKPKVWSDWTLVLHTLVDVYALRRR